MSRKMIPVEESLAAWRKDPEYGKTFNALEDEFALAAANFQGDCPVKCAQWTLYAPKPVSGRTPRSARSHAQGL